MNCKEVIKKFLEYNHFDGLYSQGECTCLSEDLATCGEDFSLCKPGYKVIDPHDPGRFYVVPRRTDKPWEAALAGRLKG